MPRIRKQQSGTLSGFHFHAPLIGFPISLNAFGDIAGILFSSVALSGSNVSLELLENLVKNISCGPKNKLNVCTQTWFGLRNMFIPLPSLQTLTRQQPFYTD